MTAKERAAKILDVPLEKVDSILAIQTPEVREALLQSEDERLALRFSAIPKEAQCTKEDGSVDLNPRNISEEEYVLHEGARRKRGFIYEERRGKYLSEMAAAGKIHESLKHNIETPHVMPTEEQRQRAIKGFMGLLTIKAIKEKFAEIMSHIFKPSHAEIVSEEIGKLKK